MPKMGVYKAINAVEGDKKGLKERKRAENSPQERLLLWMGSFSGYSNQPGLEEVRVWVLLRECKAKTQLKPDKYGENYLISSKNAEGLDDLLSGVVVCRFAGHKLDEWSESHLSSILDNEKCGFKRTWPVPVGSTMARILWNSASPLKW